ncbi:hypothetical protein WM15_26630 [Burkholderia ubonensis]|nr:hypothetical protein WM15_26630 [Burkholderia ubonensis]
MFGHTSERADDERNSRSVASGPRNRTMRNEIKAIGTDVLRQIRFNSVVSNPVLLAKRRRIAENVDEAGKKLDRKGKVGKMCEAVKYIARRGLYFERRELRRLDALAARHIRDRPEDHKYKMVLPVFPERPVS